MISAIINQSINVVWTILCYIPIVILWYLDYNAYVFWTVLAISMIPLASSEAVFNRFQLSNSKQFYRRLGISYFQLFTQKGMLAAKIIGTLDNSHKNFKRIDISKFKTEILGYEKYHCSCFLFFSLSAFYARSGGNVDVRFLSPDGKEKGNMNFEIIELKKNKQVHWRFISGPEEWIETDVVFNLSQEDDYTIVLFSHKNGANWLSSLPIAA
jgi:hypothetical protein